MVWFGLEKETEATPVASPLCLEGLLFFSSSYGSWFPSEPEHVPSPGDTMSERDTIPASFYSLEMSR